MPLFFDSSENHREQLDRNETSAASYDEGTLHLQAQSGVPLDIMSDQKVPDSSESLVLPAPDQRTEDITMGSPESPITSDLSDRDVSPPAGFSPAAKTTLPLSEKDANLPVGQAPPQDGKALPYTNSKPSATSGSMPPDTTVTTSSASAAKVTPKRKLTQAEKEAQEKERDLKRQKKADEAQAKEAAKQAKAAEKAKAEAEKEAKKVEKAKAEAEKEAKKAAKAAEKAEAEAKKEAIRKQKEEQEKAIQRKTAKQQNMLAAFVKRAPATPSKPPSTSESSSAANADPIIPSVVKAEPTTQPCVYSRLFKPFFVKNDVSLAPAPFQMNDDTKEAKSNILDEYVYKKRDAGSVFPFNPVETFQVHELTRLRGLNFKPVKEIMDKAYGDSNVSAFGAMPVKSESQAANELVLAQEQLNGIPMKALKFYEDVRPPYIGTMTTRMDASTLRKLSRRPAGRNFSALNYDYDSEAEWQDDDGEDLMSEDDEEEIDGDDELDDFLDDSDDMPAVNRPTFLGETQPSVIGLCFEDEKGVNPSATMAGFKMEFILESLPGASIDPFSTSYWEKPKKKAKEAAPSMLAAATANSTMSTMSTMNPPAHAFAVLIGSNGNAASKTDSSSTIDPKEMVSPDILDDFKRAIVSEGFREHTKLTLIDLLSKKFTTCTKPQVKKTLEHVAIRQTVPGAAKSCKHWQLLPAFSF